MPNQAASTPPPPGRNPALDGLRGYAAAAVVLHHGVLGTTPHALDVLRGTLGEQRSRYDQALKIVLSVFNGELAVGVFFVISGIVLFRALAAMDRPDASLSRLPGRFLLRRLLRIWPVMAVCLVVHFAVLQAADALAPGFVETHTLRELAENLALLRTPVNGVTWTLAVELAAAPWLLLFYLGVRRWGILPMLPVLAAALAALRSTGLLYHPAGMLTGLPMVLSGAVIEGLAAAGRVGPRWWRRLLPAGVAVAVGNQLFVAQATMPHALLLVLGAALTVAGVAAPLGGAVDRALTTPLARFLGRISYSLYLWNVVILLLVLGAAGPARGAARPIEVGLAAGLAALLAAIPVASLSERWLERPAIRLGRALTRPARPPSAALLGQMR